MTIDTGKFSIDQGRRSFISGSDPRIIIGDEEPALRLWGGKRREVEPGDLSGNLVVGKTTIRPVCAAHEEFVAALVGHPPRPVPIDAGAIDIEDRADHLNAVLKALSGYVTAILTGRCVTTIRIAA